MKSLKQAPFLRFDFARFLTLIGIACFVTVLAVAPVVAQDKGPDKKSDKSAEKDPQKKDEDKSEKKGESKKDDAKKDDKKKDDAKKEDSDKGSTISITEQLPKVNGRLKKIFAGDVPKSTAELKEMEARFQLLSEKLIKATVGIELRGSGSGVIISPDGLVLTAAHVAVRPGLPLRVILSDGTRVMGKSLGMNRALDAGMIQITTEGDYPFVEMGDSTELKLGQWCIAMGHPGGVLRRRSAPLRVGRILDVKGDLLRTDCTLVGGDSGGPLFDLDGNVIGIHSRISTTLLDNIHVPAVAYKDNWTRMANGESIRQPNGLVKVARLGVYLESDDNPRLVSKIEKDSAAQQAGIRVGDELLRIGGRKINGIKDLKRAIALKSAGSKIDIELKRDGKQVDVSLVLGSK